MDDLIGFIIDNVISLIARNRHLSRGKKSVIAFLVLNLPTIILSVFACLDLIATRVGFYIFAFVLSVIWLMITIYVVYRGHKQNWNI